MSRGTPAFVQPSLLIWARKSAGLRLEEAAHKIELTPDELQAWEKGDARPSIPQLRKLGETYKRPLAVFFLPEPPTDFDAQREFRRLAGVTPQNESPELRLALRTALYRREVAKEIYEQLGDAIPSFTVSAQANEDSETVGARIRELLGITWKKQLLWTDAYAALRGWREAIEALGILVFQTGDVELDEMRGTSIPQGPFPVIVLNNSDHPHGRIFTLLHEFSHILLFNGGNRTSLMDGKQLPEDQRLEQVSNRFAASALLPREEFLSEIARFPSALEGEEKALRLFANRIKVSPEAILRRLLLFRKVPLSLYRQKRRGWIAQSWYSFPQGVGGPPIETRVLSSAGRPFVSLVLEGYHRNAISSSAVSDYLGVQLKFVSRIADALTPAPGSSELG